MTERTSIAPRRSMIKTGKAAVGQQPENILRQAHLSVTDKRAILADWASDARAVADRPGLRQLDDGSTVHVGRILNALRELGGRIDQRRVPPRAFRPSRGKLAARWRRAFSSRDDDDDDPPPLPSLSGLPL